MIHSFYLATFTLSSIFLAAASSALAPHRTIHTSFQKRSLPFGAWNSQYNRHNTDSFIHPLYPADALRLSRSKLPPKHSFHTSISSLPSKNLPLSFLSTERQSLSFEHCCEQSDCRGGLSCFSRIAEAQCSFDAAFCLCFPEFLTMCTADDDCPDGEICGSFIPEVGQGREQICISAAAAPYSPSFAPVNESVQLLTLEGCLTTEQCLGERVCAMEQQLESPAGTICTPNTQEVCFCRMPDPHSGCLSDDDCRADGEVCAVNQLQKRFCISKALADGINGLTHEAITGEFCFFDDDCLGTRICIERNGGSCLRDCICNPPEPETCTSNNDCTTDFEICAWSTVAEQQMCVSQFAAKGSNLYEPPRAPSIDPSPSASPTGTSMASESTTNPTPSVSPTQTSTPSASLVATQTSTPSASLVATQTSTPSASLVASSPPASAAPDLESLEASPAIASSLEPTEEPVCVDATSLSHLPLSDLVFPKHVAARVLCDVDGSCATAGHMVHFKGMPMRMSSYCRMVGCSQKVILVNSPRYKRGLRISTMTNGLEFTAFAARYDTRAEEIALGSAIRLGL